MNPRRFLFCGYCAVIILVPRNPNLYTFLVNTTVWITNVLCHHYFRAFLSSGTPASKTIFHSLLWSLTISYQLHLSVLAFYVLLGNLFIASTENFVNSQPGAACVLFTPRWTSNSMLLYLFYLATLKLIIGLKPYSLMGLNHEKVSLQLNISVIVLCLVDTGLALLIQGSTCDALSSTLFLRVTTGLEFEENANGSSSLSVHLLTLITVLMLTAVEYAVAEVIINLSTYKAWFARLRDRIVDHFNQSEEDINTNNRVEEDMHVSSGQSVHHINSAVNYFADPQPLSQFRQFMILIKKMSFFAVFFLLMACIFLIFFELNFIIQLIIRVGGKLLLQCTPLYWVLVVDDVHEFTKRRITPFLASVYHFFTDAQANIQNVGRQLRETKCVRVADEGQIYVLPMAGSSTTVQRVSVEGQINNIPIVALSTTVLSVADVRPRDILPVTGSSTTVRVSDRGPNNILPITGLSTPVRVSGEGPKNVLPRKGSSTTVLKVAGKGPRDVLPVVGSSTKAQRVTDDDHLPIVVFSTTAPRVTDRYLKVSFPFKGLLTDIQE